MGQQQLLLVILVVIIVGVTTILAVNVMGDGADNANRDAVRQDLLTAASNVQELWERPRIMDGAEKDFTNLEPVVILERLRIMGILEDGEVRNENGTYSLTRSESEIVITAVPFTGGGNIQTIVCFDSENSDWLMKTDSPTAETPAGCD